MAVILPLVGNPRPQSRTRLAAEAVAAALAERLNDAGPAHPTPTARVDETIELAEAAGELFRDPSAVVDALRARVLAADIVIVASPTYKATYTGLLKAFLDRFDTGSWRPLIAVPLLTVGSPAHTLAVDTTLRPLLIELGASLPTAGIAFPAGRIDDRDEIAAEWADREALRLRHALA